MNNDVFINNDRQENNLVNEDMEMEESESIPYYEYGAHFKYKDLFMKLLKIKGEREKQNIDEDSDKNKIINNNNIIINNNLNLNLFNKNKHKIISRNLQANNYINNVNIMDNSNTFISNFDIEQLNKTALLPSSDFIQQKIDDYLQNLEKNKLIINDKAKLKIINNKSNKNTELNLAKKDKAKIINIKNNHNIKTNPKNKLNDNKENLNINSQKNQKKNKSPEKNAINLKKRKNNMITLSFKYNKNSNLNNIIFRKIKEISNHKYNGNWTKQLIEKMTKSKTKTKSKSKSNSKNKKKKINKNINNIKIYNKMKKLSYNQNNYNNKRNYKDNSQNFTTKIIQKYKRTNKFLNSSNIIDSRKAHSSSITKNEKYNLNSLIHNSNIYNIMNETRNKSPEDKLKQISKSHLNGKRINNIITSTNCIKSTNKSKAKNQLLRNSMNIYSIGVSVAKTRNSNLNSEINFSKSNSKNKKKIKPNKNIKLNPPSKTTYLNNKLLNYGIKSSNQKKKGDQKILRNIRTSSPFSSNNNINKSNKGLKKQNSNNINTKVNKNNHYWNNKQKKKNLQNNKSLDSQKLCGKSSKIKANDASTSVNKNIITKNKNKILSRNIGTNNINNYLIKNYTNVKFNTKEIFNYKLSNLTITNLNKIKDQMSRNGFNNLNSFTGKTKKNNIMNNTNSFFNNNDYLKLLNTVNKNKGTYFTNSNNSDYIKKGIVLNGSKSKNNIYLKNNFFNKPVKKLNRKNKK